MATITREQRIALKRVYDRCELGDRAASGGNLATFQNRSFDQRCDHVKSYRQFRRTVQHSSYDDCIMVPWCGMWLGIEKDGYTHS